ncbi:hypothetical protein M5K25_018861 [Dendrobium thyrsiflorum]|uniref:DUF4283 domain-containing protein n=1 Tax=Dendrobium thyrsiflorum TaxID=117978 RepID=A0ABD0UK83_DENTH
MAGGTPPPSSSSPTNTLPSLIPLLSTTEFPLLAPTAGSSPSLPPRSWTNIFAPPEPSSKNLDLSFYPSEPDIIPFTGEKLSKGAEDWGLCLVGYSVGRRPFYEALQEAIKKTWTIRGSVQILSLSDGFFLFKFSCVEDYESIWSRGVWFILGRPFILQQWHPKFKPKREQLTSVPIWIKIHDLPLACWNSEGISRIASKVGVPLAADSLTTQKSRLTYARVCVQVDNQATYPEEILVSLDGDVVQLKVQYEWRPSPCAHCKSLVHPSSSCPSKPHTDSEEPPAQKAPPPRGRSVSRKPRARLSKPPIQKPSIVPASVIIPESAHQKGISTAITNDAGLTLHYQPHSPTQQKTNTITLQCSDPSHIAGKLPYEASLTVPIPNLNSPTKDMSSSSTDTSSQAESSQPGFTSPNKFNVLMEQDISSNLNCISDASKVVKHVTKQDFSNPTNSGVPKKPTRGNPVMDFCSKLRTFRGLIKSHNWANSFLIQTQLAELHVSQATCLDRVSADPLNRDLNASLKSINSKITELASIHASWVIQRAKAKWLLQGEDDLKFLYAKIRARNAKNNAGNALRYSVFAWLCIAGGLKTAAALSLRNVYISPLCPLCHLDIESVNHLFFECNFSYAVLTKLIPKASVLLLRPTATQLFDWTEELNLPERGHSLFKLYICCVIYHVWKERNSRRFGGQSICPVTLYHCIQRSVRAKVLKWKNGDKLLNLI